MALVLFFLVPLFVLLSSFSSPICITTSNSDASSINGKYESFGNCNNFPVWTRTKASDGSDDEIYILFKDKYIQLDSKQQAGFAFYECKSSSGFDSNSCMFNNDDMSCDSAPFIYCLTGVTSNDNSDMNTNPDNTNKTYNNFNDCDDWHTYHKKRDITLNVNNGNCPETSNNNGNTQGSNSDNTDNTSHKHNQQEIESDLWIWLGVIIIIGFICLFTVRFAKKGTNKLMSKIDGEKNNYKHKDKNFVKIEGNELLDNDSDSSDSSDNNDTIRGPPIKNTNVASSGSSDSNKNYEMKSLKNNKQTNENIRLKTPSLEDSSEGSNGI